MGILNVTPDSFFDGGKIQSTDQALRLVESQIRDGADIVDIGGMSSRPGARVIPEEEERRRVIPILKEVRKAFPEIWLSIDTVRSRIALEAAETGVDLINDISAGQIDSEMFHAVATTGLPYVLMHMKGRPETMQMDPEYTDVISEVMHFLMNHMRRLRDAGVHDVIVDPGFGFGKSVEDNYGLLRQLHVFQILDAPILVGLSRKSMICKILNLDPEQALNGTTALHMKALLEGAKILRVHDVRQAKEVVDLFWALKSS